MTQETGLQKDFTEITTLLPISIKIDIQFDALERPKHLLLAPYYQNIILYCNTYQNCQLNSFFMQHKY